MPIRKWRRHRVRGREGLIKDGKCDRKGGSQYKDMLHSIVQVPMLQVATVGNVEEEVEE
jgi:hypothetical protein